MSRETIERAIINNRIERPDLGGLVCLAHALGYPLSEEEVRRCIRRYQSGSTDENYVQAGNVDGWKRIGVSHRSVVVVLNVLMQQAASELVTLILQHLDRKEMTEYVIQSAEDDDLVEAIRDCVHGGLSPSTLQIYAAKCAEAGDIVSYMKVVGFLGLPPETERLELILQENIRLRLLDRMMFTLKLLSRTLTEEEASDLISSCIMEDDPADVAEVYSIVGRHPTDEELSKLASKLRTFK